MEFHLSKTGILILGIFLGWELFKLFNILKRKMYRNYIRRKYEKGETKINTHFSD
jgi:hypothetical protein